MVSKSVCRNEKNCFQSPDGNAIVSATWQLDGDYVKFLVSGELSADEKYLAIGFSTTGLMSPSATVDCILNGDEVEIKSAHNEQNRTKRNNRFLSPPTLGLHGTKSGSYEDGLITCSFAYVRTKSLAGANRESQAGDAALLADLQNQKYDLMFARGPVTDQGRLGYHKTNKVVIPRLINFTEHMDSSNDKKVLQEMQPRAVVCELEENCFRYPENCVGNDCDVEVGWKLDGDYVKFTAAGLMPVTDKWFAIGFSSTGTMSPSATVDCMRDNAAAVTIKSAVNEERDNRFLSPPSLGLHETMSGEYVDGRITCHFSYIKSKSLVSGLPLADKDLLTDLANNKYYLLTAMGPIGADGVLQYHGISKVVNPKAVDFTEMPTDKEISV